MDHTVIRAAPAVVRFAVGGAVLAYVATRAAQVPLTYDEAVAAARFATGDPWHLADFATAVNHHLQSLLLRLSTLAFGTAPWALRLPTVLASVIYLGAAAAVVAPLAPRALGAAGFVLLVAQPYLLEYFALARGYGLAAAAITAALVTLVWWDDAPAGPRRERLATWTLGLAGAAAMANYSTLPLALVVAAVMLAASRRRAGPMRPWGTTSPWARGVIAAAVIAAFSTVVYSRDRTLAADRDVPVGVAIQGLYEEEYSRIRVYLNGATGRLREVRRGRGPEWSVGRVDDAWEEMRIVLPIASDLDLSTLDVRVGETRYRRDRRSAGPWTAVDRHGERALLSQPVLEWRPDRAQWRLAVRYGATTAAVIAGVAILAGVVLTALARARQVEGATARAVLTAWVVIGGACAAPVFLLRRGDQLFYGGTTGLLHDVVGSLVVATARGVDLAAIWGLAVALGGLVVAALVVLAANLGEARRAGRPALLGVAVLAGYLVLTAANSRLFDVPYPHFRTAIVALPVLLVTAIRCAAVVAAVGPWTRRITTAGVVMMAAVAGGHMLRVANLSTTTDWPRDAAAPAMLDAIDAHPTTDLRRIGVEWEFYPVVRYYADRRSTATRRYDVVVLPGDGLPVEFTYGSAGLPGGAGELLQRYPDSRTALWRSPR